MRFGVNMGMLQSRVCVCGVCVRAHLLCGVDWHAVDLVHLRHPPLVLICKELH